MRAKLRLLKNNLGESYDHLLRDIRTYIGYLDNEGASSISNSNFKL
ncbi:hypothetical protein HWX41_21605 [Bacillus paramycoides]|nr:hypothetical protein [Bacillus paramycoides]NWK71599.1 hypothetical protein [Bacillus paramycoides]